MSDTIYYRFVMKRDSSANFTTKNTLLLEGEFGFELDTKKKKVGDGVTPWNSLEYDGGGVSSPMPINNQTGTSYTAQITDRGGEILCDNSGAFSLLIPKDVFQVGDWFLVSQANTGVVTVTGDTGVTFEVAGTHKTVGKSDLIGFEMIAANVWRFIGSQTDAPIDGVTYGRKDAAWIPLSSTTVGSLNGLNDQTGTSYTVAALDAGKDIRCTNSSPVTLYIDKQATVPVANNFWALFSQGGAGKVTAAVVPGSGVLLRAPNGADTNGIYDARGIERITGDEWRVW